MFFAAVLLTYLKLHHQQQLFKLILLHVHVAHLYHNNYF